MQDMHGTGNLWYRGCGAEGALCAWAQVRETRALMCCFAAVDPREACLQQLRHTEDWSPVDQDADRAQCRAAWVRLASPDNL